VDTGLNIFWAVFDTLNNHLRIDSCAPLFA
jgi:hypothetical protein